MIRQKHITGQTIKWTRRHIKQHLQETDVENHMQEADINTWIKDSVVYLTRNDWSTFPKKIELAATQELADIMTADNQDDVEINEQYTKT